MRPILAMPILAAIIATACVACTKADANKTGSDIKAAAASIKDDPNVRRAAADVKSAAKDAGAEIKAGAKQAGVELKRSGSNIKQAAEDAKPDKDDKSRS